MISLAGRDIIHSWGKFVLTGIGLGLLIGVTLTMAGVYRGMVDDARALLNNSGADLWVVQQDTLGPYAEPSSVRDDHYRGIKGGRRVVFVHPDDIAELGFTDGQQVDLVSEWRDGERRAPGFRLVAYATTRGCAAAYFPETNVRFYSVDAVGRRGVVFGSLEAARLAFVLGARSTLGLNYTWARMRIRPRASMTGPISLSTTPLMRAGCMAAMAMVTSPPRDVPMKTASCTPSAVSMAMESAASIRG